MTIFLPPLRERRDDIPLLLKYFLAKAQGALNKPHIEGMSPECLELLTNYSWPGNVREMQSIVQQAVLNTIGPIIIPEFLPREISSPHVSAARASAELVRSPIPVIAPATVEDSPHSDADFPSIADLGLFIEQRLLAKSTNLATEVIERVERYLFTRVLQVTNGNQSQAAEILGVTRGKIRDRIAAFNISMERQVRMDSDIGH
jgi:DNA-binding NtrC family response regulator